MSAAIDETRMRLLRTSLSVLLAGSLIFGASMWWQGQLPTSRLLGPGLLALLSVVSLVHLRRRQPLHTLGLLACGGWAIATLMGFRVEGVRTPILLAYPLIVIFTGWLLGAAWAKVFTGASALALLAMAGAEAMGWLKPMAPIPSFTLALAQCLILAVALTLTLNLLKVFQERMDEALRLGRLAEQNLATVRTRELELQRLVEAMPALICQFDAELRCVLANRHFARFFGPSDEELNRRPLQEVFGPNAFDELRPLLQRALTGESLRHQARFGLGEGQAEHVFEIAMVPRRLEGHSDGGYALLHDVTERERSAERLRQLVSQDSLTGIGNRTHLMDRLGQALKRSARRPQCFALMVLDLDGFKAVNDSHGHERGDQLLQQVARTLAETLRADDTVARLGGDEFVLLAENLHSPEDALLIAAKVVERIARLASPDAPISASLGLALHPQQGAVAEELIRKADVALYKAKAAGRNQWRLAD
ncbi:GGDEF domain-containing protein [Pelomonas sp. SE-A7]|uniref:GGDEF domain-containing protein n=1 Tax=Pelomonas sp. SE-A7 TaxID=3054953 RepID=UPI00259CD596|nr:GGDEF domain-containing protein [Pelomonas sp. SE-A7]MDM4767814.1 GGDEF domain-containing protein [Pelomonas sp. SE-A7]